MKRIILFILAVIFNTFTITQAANIIYPKSNNVTINSDRTFFTGYTKPNAKLKINSENIDIHPSGAFYKPVELNYGQNTFVIQDEDLKQIYNILRPENKPSVTNKNYDYTEYKKSAIYEITKNNTPLRSTPIDSGMNRLQHLDKGILVEVIGEKGDFFKVKLARDDYAWINKTFLSLYNEDNGKPAKIYSFAYDNDPPYSIYHIKLDKKVPYILSERLTYEWEKTDSKPMPKYSGLDLVVYNVDGYPENKFEQFIDFSGNIKGYKSYYNSDNELVIYVSKLPTINKKHPLEGLTITIDPGHGGKEAGAIGCLGNKEKDINLEIGVKLKDYLQNAGAKVYMTRDNDTEVSLYDRVKYSQKNKSDIFISIHNNAIPDSAAFKESFGTELYYYSPLSKKLANSILNSLTKELDMYNGGLYQRSFAVLRNTESLNVLIELGYMINPDNNDKIRTPEFQDKAAKAILQGLEDYLNDIQK